MKLLTKIKSLFSKPTKPIETKQREFLVPVNIREIAVDKIYWVVSTVGYYQCKGGRLLGVRGNPSQTTIQSLRKGFVFKTEQDAKTMYQRLMDCRDVK